MTRSDLIAQLYDIAHNEEFTADHRHQMMTVAMADHDTAQAADHPASLAIHHAINVDRLEYGIRISPNAGIPIGS